MAAASIIADRDIDRLIDRMSFSRITVGRQDGMRGFHNDEAVVLYLEFLASNQLYYPVGRIFMTPENAHALSVEIETMAKALRFGYTPKSKE